MPDTLETKVAVLQHDLGQIREVFSRLDLAIAKISDVSGSLKEMIAVHESKLDAQDGTNKDIYESLESHRKETLENNKELHSRMTTMNREYDTKLQQTETRLLAAIDSLKELIEREEEKNEERIASLEKTKYIMVGVGTAVGFVISSIIPIIVEVFS